jgi:hypothetical protein
MKKTFKISNQERARVKNVSEEISTFQYQLLFGAVFCYNINIINLILNGPEKEK